MQKKLSKGDMTVAAKREEQRRRFLKWLSASPMLSLAGGAQLLAQEVGLRRSDDLDVTRGTRSVCEPQGCDQRV